MKISWAVLPGLLLFWANTTFAQLSCSCSLNLFDEDAFSCDTTFLKDGSCFYYQYNCDSIWLTYQTDYFSRSIFSMDVQLAPYAYRWGYQLVTEFDSYLLFRYGCAANGPCMHVLLSKATGAKKETLPEMIYNASDSQSNTLIYFSEERDSLSFYSVDEGRKTNVAFDLEKFRDALIPEYMFEKVIFDDEKISLYFESGAVQRTDSKYMDSIIINRKLLK